MVTNSVRNPCEIRIWDCNPHEDWINPIQFQILDLRVLEIHIPHSQWNRIPNIAIPIPIPTKQQIHSKIPKVWNVGFGGRGFGE